MTLNGKLQRIEEQERLLIESRNNSSQSLNRSDLVDNSAVVGGKSKKSKKKKRKHKDVKDEDGVCVVEKKGDAGGELGTEQCVVVDDEIRIKKKKRKTKHSEENEVSVIVTNQESVLESEVKDVNHCQDNINTVCDNTCTAGVDNNEPVKKKKKKKKSSKEVL